MWESINDGDNMNNSDQKGIEDTLSNCAGLCALPIKSIVLWKRPIECSLYIRLNDRKFVKVVHPHEDYLDTLIKYSNKGVKSVWLEEGPFDQISAEIKEIVQKEIASNKEIRFEYAFSELNTSFDVFQEIACTTGLTRGQLAMAQEIAATALEEIKKHKNFLSKFLRLKENCNEAFLIGLYTGFLSTMIAENFPWASPKLSCAVMTAAMVSDIHLNGEEMEEHLKWERGQVPYEKLMPKIRVHADVLSVKLTASNNSRLSDDMIRTIKYHHHDHLLNPTLGENERADIDIMPAIYIISRKVAHAMYLEDTAFEIAPLIESLNGSYQRGNFKKVVKALETFWRYDNQQ